MNACTSRRQKFVAVVVYVAVAILWGTRTLNRLFGEDSDVVTILIVSAHVAVGAALPQWRTLLLPSVPLGVGTFTGWDLNETSGYIVMLGVFFVALVLIGIVVARVVSVSALGRLNRSFRSWQR